MSHAVERIVVFFENLTPHAIERLGDIYGDAASFKDPFHEARGVPAIQSIFRRMYERLDEPRFVVTARITDGMQCFLTWDFRFRFRGRAATQCIRGASHLVLLPDGRIGAHRDYWDAAEELYQRLPVLGGLMRWLRRQVAG